MTLTERAQKVLTEIDAALALSEKATPGPWEPFPALVGSVACRVGTRIIRYAKGPIADTYFGVKQGNPSYAEAKANATFIAASRTLLPTSLLCLKTAIEGWLRLIAEDKHKIVPYLTVLKPMQDALTALCDQWEAGR